MIAPHEAPPTGPMPDAMAAIPILRTERLVLRAPMIDDFDILADIGMGPRSGGIGGPYTREDMWFDYAQMTATWIWRGHGYWTVTDADDTVLGFAGIGFEPGDQEPELGYLFAASAEGQGFATEAGLAALEFAFGHHALTSLVSYITRDNAASIAVATRLGATRDAVAEAALGAADMTVWRHNITGGRA